MTETCFVVDFGELKELKAWLEETFDHTLLICQDDPEIERFRELDRVGAARVIFMPNVGMEMTSVVVWNKVNELLLDRYAGRAWCSKVEVRENDKNSAFFEGIPTWANAKPV